MLLFITWSVVLIGLSLVNFRRAKVVTSVFISVLLLHTSLQVALKFLLVARYGTLTNICSAAILLTFIPSLVVFVFAACQDFKHWWALSAAGAALTCLWFFIEYFPYFAGQSC